MLDRRDSDGTMSREVSLAADGRLNISGQANRTSARVMQDTMLEPLLEAARTISQRLDGAVGR